jgi:hypothetical protein
VLGSKQMAEPRRTRPATAGRVREIHKSAQANRIRPAKIVLRTPRKSVSGHGPFHVSAAHAR